MNFVFSKLARGLALSAALALPLAAQQATVLVIAGAPGEAEFVPDFKLQIEAWTSVSLQAKARHLVIGGESTDAAAPAAGTDRDRVKQALEAETKTGAAELWIVLVGHGTFDGKEAKLNLRGPDLSATDLAAWLKPFGRPLAIIDTASSSAPFLAKLAAPRRVIVTATRSGHEHNYARFGKFLAAAVGDPQTDLDKDGQISLLESFLGASHRTTEFYKTEGRLATEHALLDDNGDGLGTPADWFRGTRATKHARDGAALDGLRAHQFHLVRSPLEQTLSIEARARRDQLEQKIAELRDTKAKLAEAAYYKELERLMLELAVVYESGT